MAADLGPIAYASARFAEMARDGIQMLAYARREEADAARVAAERETERESAQAIEDIADATARAHVAKWNANSRAEWTGLLSELLDESIQVACAALLELARLFIGKQRGAPRSWPEGRLVNGIPLRDIVWAGRNQAVHSDEGEYRPEVLAVFEQLEKECGAQFEVKRGDKVSRAREVVELLGWLDPSKFAEDVRALLA